MRKLILVAVLVAMSVTAMAVDPYFHLDNNAIRKAKGKADTSAWFPCNDYQTLVLFHSVATMVADSVGLCSLFVDLKYAGTGVTWYATKTGTTTAADSTWYRLTFQCDTTGAQAFRYRVKADSRGDSLTIWSGFYGIPKFR